MSQVLALLTDDEVLDFGHAFYERICDLIQTNSECSLTLPKLENELLEYLAMNILKPRGVDEDPRDRAERRADAEPSGEPFDEDTVGTAFPKLSALFG